MAKWNYSSGLRKCALSQWKGRTNACRWCNGLLSGRQKLWCSRSCAWSAYSEHCWHDARKYVLRRDLFMCVRCASKVKLEVNHKVPVLGKHNENGCFHHTVGLEVLCHKCHVVETKRQRDAGLLRKL